MILQNKGDSTPSNHEKGTGVFRDLVGTVLVGRIRRGYSDHLIIMNETHLRAILQSYMRYYNAQRTHLGINKEHLNREKSKPRGRLIACSLLSRRGQCDSSDRICAHFPLLQSTDRSHLPSHCTEHHGQFMIMVAFCSGWNIDEGQGTRCAPVC
jgi:hypothetical protein